MPTFTVWSDWRWIDCRYGRLPYSSYSNPFQIRLESSFSRMLQESLGPIRDQVRLSINILYRIYRIPSRYPDWNSAKKKFFKKCRQVPRIRLNCDCIPPRRCPHIIHCSTRLFLCPLVTINYSFQVSGSFLSYILKHARCPYNWG